MTEQHEGRPMKTIYVDVTCECCNGRGKVGKFVEQKEVPSSSPIFDSMTPEQQRHCEFMGFDPDCPDRPLD
jgi:hypothetical protein